MCSKHSHNRAVADHHSTEGAHCDLLTTFGERDMDADLDSVSIPYVLSTPRFLKPKDAIMPSLLKLEYLMEGRDKDSISQVCLHRYKTVSGGIPTVSFDFDSILAFPTSLAVAHLGLSYTSVSTNTSNLVTDVHLTMQV